MSYKHISKITLSNGIKGSVEVMMPTDVAEWNKRVLGDGDVALSRQNELKVRAFIIAAQVGMRKCRTLELAAKYLAEYVFGEKGSPQPTNVSKELKWTPEMLKHFKELGIEVN